MEKIELQVKTREISGKKVRFLRRQNITPVHLLGHGIDSLTLQCDTPQLQRVLSQAGKTRLVSLKLDESKKPRNVVVREIQKDAVTGRLLHVDFYQVRMEEKIKVEVPIVLVGEAPALKVKDNTLVQELTILNIECLPDQIPNSVEVNLSPLTEADQSIQVKSIALGAGITILNDPEQTIARVSKRVIEAAPPPKEAVVEEAAAAAEAAAPAEGGAKEGKEKEGGAAAKAKEA